MKLSHAVGAASALATAALTATIALACPPAPPVQTCPPQPCGGCGCNISNNKAWVSGAQSSSVSGDFRDYSGTQTMDMTTGVRVGPDIKADSHTFLSQTASADRVTMATMNQTGAAGASAVGPNNVFPGMWNLNTMGSGAQELNTWGKNIMHDQTASTHQRSEVGGIVSKTDGTFNSWNSASGWGDLNNKQSFTGGTQAQGWGFIPFPMSWGGNFNIGNNHGVLTLTQFAQLNFI